MASDDGIAITGLAELQAALERLAPNIERKLMRGALRAGQKLVLERARAGIHSVSGDLAAGLKITTSARGGLVRATVTAGGKKKKGAKAAFYAHMVEFGTAAHVIKAKDGGALVFGGRAYAQLQHPGAKKKPFMRPALDAAAVPDSEAFRAVGAYLQGRITQELDQLPDQTDRAA